MFYIFKLNRNCGIVKMLFETKVRLTLSALTNCRHSVRKSFARYLITTISHFQFVMVTHNLNVPTSVGKLKIAIHRNIIHQSQSTFGAVLMLKLRNKLVSGSEVVHTGGAFQVSSGWVFSTVSNWTSAWERRANAFILLCQSHTNILLSYFA